jgi:transposase
VEDGCTRNSCARVLELQRARQRAIAHGRGEAIAKVRQLLRLRAVGPTGAWVYVNEFFGWRRFRNRKEVGASSAAVHDEWREGRSCSDTDVGGARTSESV